jgi:hypothetical protein
MSDIFNSRKADQRHSTTCLICLNEHKVSETCPFSRGYIGEDSEYVIVESSITRSNRDDEDDEEFVIVEKGGKAPGKKTSAKGKISRGTRKNLSKLPPKPSVIEPSIGEHANSVEVEHLGLEKLVDLYPPDHILDMLSSYESTIPEEVTKSSEKNCGGRAMFKAKNTYFRPFEFESRHDYSKMSYCWEHWPGTGGTLCEERASCFECY